MNATKFLFIMCVNDMELYTGSLSYIHSLNIPANHTIEVMPIYGAASMAAGYNTALTHDAKYKIYLHQDLFILNKNFLTDILHLFGSNPDLGMLGVAGSKKLPSNGIWWEGNTRGKLYFKNKGTPALLDLGECSAPYEQVAAIDGILMATQYDVSWREDLIPGFHFYDISQSFEFRRHGLTVGIPPQEDPWCYHHGKESLNLPLYDQGRRQFLHHYQNEL